MDLLQIAMIMGIPSAVTAFCFWLIEQRINRREEEINKKIERQEKEAEEKEALREESRILLIQSVNAAISLGEATARAVQRIPDAKCNGDMHIALDYATKVKHEQKDFLTRQGVKNLVS